MKLAKYLYVVGGCALGGEKEPISMMERIRIEQSDGERGIRAVSENCGQLHLARRSPSVFVRNLETIIVAGGCAGPNDHLNSIEYLRKKDDSMWESSVSNVQTPEFHSCGAFDSDSDKFVIFGGFDTHQCLSSVQVLSFDTKDEIEATLSKGFLPKLKNSTALKVNEYEFLLFGGWEDEKTTSSIVRRVKFNAEYTAYDVIFESFLPYPIEGHCLIQKGSNVFLIGGFDGCFVCSTIICYNLETKKSEKLDVKLEQKRENHVAGLIGDRYVIIAGGWDGKNSLDSIEVFEVMDEYPYFKKAVMATTAKLNIARNRPSGLTL